jgi:FMN phosphatase YigB (HAD superfamily)
MRLIAESRKLQPREVLFVDDKYDIVAQAIEAGYRGMTTVEVMTRKYYQDIIKSAPKKEKEPLP